MTASRSTPGPVSRLRIKAFCGCLLTFSAFPALAGPGLVADSVDQYFDAGSVTRSLVSEPIRIPDHEVLSASDINQLIAAEADMPFSGSGRVQSLLRNALGLLGTPYRWGGTTPDGGFDCSGLVGYVFRTTLGIELPRVSREMARNGEKVDRAALSAGDLVFFSRRGRVVDHVGIYLGDGRFVHAPRTGKDVMVSELENNYWSRRFMQARRVVGGT